MDSGQPLVPPSTLYAPRRGKPWLAVVIVLALVVIGIVLYFSLSSALGNAAAPGTPMKPQTLVLELGTNAWKAPNGSFFSGFVSYSPHTGRISGLLPPALAVSTLGGFRGQSGNLYVFRKASSTDGILRVSVGTSTEPGAVATADASDTSFGYVADSPDGHAVAYARIGGASGPEAYLRDAEGSTSALGSFIPIAFSPGGTMVLVAASSSYELVPIASKVPERISGIPAAPSVAMTRISQGGKCLFVRNMIRQGPAELYYLDWSGASARHVGTVSITSADSYGFTSGDTFMVVNGSTATEYSCATTTLAAVGSYDVGPFPRGAQILGTLP